MMNACIDRYKMKENGDQLDNRASLGEDKIEIYR